MFVLDNNNGRNDTPQLSYNTKYDKLILTSDLSTTPHQLVHTDLPPGVNIGLRTEIWSNISRGILQTSALF